MLVPVHEHRVLKFSTYATCGQKDRVGPGPPGRPFLRRLGLILEKTLSGVRYLDSTACSAAATLYLALRSNDARSCLPSLGVLRHLIHKPRLSPPLNMVTEGSPIAVQRLWDHGWSLRAIAQDASISAHAAASPRVVRRREASTQVKLKKPPTP